MDTFTVTFVGHRYIDNINKAGTQLDYIIEELLKTKKYVEFLIGRNGDFDLYAAAAVTRIKRKLETKNSSLVLLLPYITSEYKTNKDFFEQYYNEIELCDSAARAHFKSSISIRNREMIDRADLIICYITHDSGGAFKTVQYAKKHHKMIINIADIE